jgi:hypothetical protein
VIGADDSAIGEVSGTQGSIAVGAKAFERMDGSFVVTDHIGVYSDDGLHAGPGLKIFQSTHLQKRHMMRLTCVSCLSWLCSSVSLPAKRRVLR